MPLPTSLETVRPAWQEQLQAWAADGSLASAARHALELGAEDPPLLSELVSQWTEGDFSALPPIVLLPASSMPGAAGAYAISTGSIYLNEDWLETASDEQVIAVLTEELGHHLDALLDPSDTPGDEGELISRLLLSADLSAVQHQAISLRTRSDPDSGGW